MNLLHFDSQEKWESGTVSIWRDRLSTNPALRQCLASGHTPIPLFRRLADSVHKGQISFARTTIFALDEFGGLPLDDPGTCRNMLLRDLVNHIDLPERNFHFLDASAADLRAECEAFDRQIGEGLDLVVLGIGTNGHLGMNEPGSAPDSATRRTELHEGTVAASARYLAHERLPRWGLTVGMKQFFAAREVWLIATGHRKAEIVRRVAKGDITDQVPASLMRRHSNCWLLVDADAGSLL
jgi:glucosamine-6-phosphate deaminase